MAKSRTWKRRRSAPPTVPLGQPLNPTTAGRSSVRSLLAFTAVCLAMVLAGTALGRFSGPPYADAWAKGTATVEKCERRGPVDFFDGIGFYDACYVWVEWSDKASERLFINDPGFFRGEKPGDTVKLGDNMSRPEVKNWWALDLLKGVLIFFGLLGILAGAVLLAVRFREWLTR